MVELAASTMPTQNRVIPGMDDIDGFAAQISTTPGPSAAHGRA